jgi:hypothetical protein
MLASSVAIGLLALCVGVDPPNTPDPPLTPNFKCRSSLDCDLNGECANDGRCVCLAGWTGPSCGTLDLLPAKFSGSWPVKRPVPPEWWGERNTPGGWGGSMQQADDGTHHIFAASGCYIPQRVMHMDGWQISHGVSETGPEGPYKFLSTVSPATSYNPHTARLPDGRYLLYYNGAPTVPTPSGYSSTCTGNETLAPRHTSLSVRHSPVWNKTGTCSVKDCFDQNCQPQQGANTSACIDAGCVLDPGEWAPSRSIHSFSLI